MSSCIGGFNEISPQECSVQSGVKRIEKRKQDHVAQLRCFLSLLHSLSIAMSNWGQLNATETRTLISCMCYCEYEALKARTSSAFWESTFFCWNIIPHCLEWNPLLPINLLWTHITGWIEHNYSSIVIAKVNSGNLG